MTGIPADDLRTDRLTLRPLRISDAAVMVDVLAEETLYQFTGGRPPGFAELERWYQTLVAGSPDESERWYNWIVRLVGADAAIGFVQATVTDGAADIAWVLGLEWQGNGYAAEAAGEMCAWLKEAGVRRFTAHIHPRHTASQRVAERVGLQATSEVDEDGEVVWATAELG